MIVRILTEGQYYFPGVYIDELNEIDNRLVDAVETENLEEFQRTLKEMLDLVLPEPDITLREAEELFTGEGLVPG